MRLNETIETFFSERRKLFDILKNSRPGQMPEEARRHLEAAAQLRRDIVAAGGEGELRRAEILAARKVAA
ncbi:MAG: hypothetical protein DIJKHBIC_04167 [Thermoanaerobaculia bacterium]|nr:hypothetical protein [Thermoanaerobaculia bacterium]